MCVVFIRCRPDRPELFRAYQLDRVIEAIDIGVRRIEAQARFVVVHGELYVPDPGSVGVERDWHGNGLSLHCRYRFGESE